MQRRILIFVLVVFCAVVAPARAAGDFVPGTPLVAHEHGVQAIAFAPDGQTLASGSWWRDPQWGPRGQIKLWNADGSLQSTLVAHSSDIKSLTFSPDGRTLASGAWAGTLVLFDVASKQPVKLPWRHQAPIIFLAFSPDGQTLLSGDESGSTIFWDVTTRQPREMRTLQSVPGVTNKIRAYAYSWPRRTFATGDRDQSVRLWPPNAESRVLTNNKGLVTALAFAPDDTILVSANWMELWLWDIATDKAVRAFTGHRAALGALTFSPDGQYIASADASGEVIFNNVGTGHYYQKPKVHAAKITALAFAPDGRTLASASADGTIVWWKAGG